MDNLVGRKMILFLMYGMIDGAYGVTGNIPDCESVVESSSLSGHPKP